MNWTHPKHQTDKKRYRIEQISALKVSWKTSGCDSRAVFKKWRFFKNYERANHIGLHSLQLLGKILIPKLEKYKKREN